jgi:hypothetical protein
MQRRFVERAYQRRLFGSGVFERRLVGLGHRIVVGVGLRIGDEHVVRIGHFHELELGFLDVVVGIERLGKLFRHDVVVERVEHLRIVVGLFVGIVVRLVLGVFVRRWPGRSDAHRIDDAVRMAGQQPAGKRDRVSADPHERRGRYRHV